MATLTGTVKFFNEARAFGGGSVTLQKLAADSSTYVTALTAFTAAGYASVQLPPGTYRFSIATATAVYINMVAIARAG